MEIIFLNQLLFLISSFFIAYHDIKSHRIPDRFLIRIFLLWSMLSLFELERVKIEFFTSAIIFLFYLLLYYLSAKKIGLGDVKFSFVLALIFSAILPELPFTLLLREQFSAVIAGWILAGLYLFIRFLIDRAAITRRMHLPFAPFMILGAISQVGALY